MARLVIILGNPGSGKSTSLRNLKKTDVNVISPIGKELPFKTDIKVNKIADLDVLIQAIDKTKAPMVVIDDANYYLSIYKGKHLNDKNPYEAPKYIAHTFTKLIEKIILHPTEQNFYIFAHTEKDQDGVRQFKTTGNFIRDDLAPEGLTNILVEAFYDDGYKFRVHKDDERSPAKTPMGMFKDDVIDNDLKLVNDTINNYYKEG